MCGPKRLSLNTGEKKTGKKREEEETSKIPFFLRLIGG